MITNRKPLAVLFICLTAILFMGAVTNLNWITQIKNMPVIDARTYGVKCDGSTDDGPAIQAALDAVPASNGGSPSPVVVQLPAGNCLIATTPKIRKAGLILKGFGGVRPICNNSGCSGGGALSGGTILTAASSFDGPLLQAKASDVTNPSITVVLRGVGIQNLSFDSTAAVGAGHFSTHYQVETGSLSNPEPFDNLTFMGHKAGAILFAADLASTSTYFVNPYPPEGIVLSNFFSSSAATSVTNPAVKLWGVNQTRVVNGRIFAGTTQTASGTTSDIAAVEVSSDNYNLNVEGVTIENVSGGAYAVWIRVRGADNNRNPCSTPPSSGGCAVSGSHIAPFGVYMKDNFAEGFNRGLVVCDETNGSGGGRNYAVDVHADATNRYISAYGSNVKIADAHFLAGGEISAGIEEGAQVISLDNTTQQVTSYVPYNGGTFPVQGGSGANFAVITITPLNFAGLPPAAPIGTTAVCSTCSCSSGGTCSGGGGFRGVVYNGSTWVGQ